jgi:hypothetical protein
MSFGGGSKEKEGSSSFLKKRTKKLLTIKGGLATGVDTTSDCARVPT